MRIAMLLLLLLSLFAYGEMVDTFEFQSPTERARAVELAKSLRCPQCQNQNLVESNSPIAYDLRLEVYRMVDEGKSNAEIVQAMTARFGNFVLYKPPFEWKTALLWLLPLGLLLFAGGLLWRKLRRPQADGALLEPDLPRTLLKQDKSAVGFSKVFYGLGLLLLIGLPTAYYFSSERSQAVKAGLAASTQYQQTVAARSAAENNDSRLLSLQNQLRQDPNDGENWYQLGQLYLLNNDFDSALQSFSRAARLIGEKPYILSAAATALYYRAGQRMSPQAEALIKQVLAADPDDTAALSLLASEAFLQADYGSALSLWQQILDSGRAHVERRSIIESMHMAEGLQGAKE